MASPIQNSGHTAVKVWDFTPNHASVALPTVALTSGATPAPRTTNARTSRKVSSRTGAPACPVHERRADSRAKGVADIDQKARRQRTVEPHELREHLSQTARQYPPRPTVGRGEDKRRDENPARRPNGNRYSGDDCERLSESAAQDIGRKKQPQVQELRTVRPDAHHRLLLPDKESLGPLSAWYSTCSQILGGRTHGSTSDAPRKRVSLIIEITLPRRAERGNAIFA